MMVAGYVHLGPPSTGVSRYGRMVADYVAAHTAWTTREAVVCAHSIHPRWRELVATARELAGADVVHVQYAPSLWGGGFRQIAAAEAFCRGVSPPLIVGIHDLVARPPLATALAIRALARRASALVVGTEAERDRLRDLGLPSCVEVVPHFVEPRPLLVSRERARRRLELDGRRVVTLLGYIHHRKGHDIALDALALLPSDAVLVLAGGPVPDGERHLVRIRDYVRRLRLEDRVRITGYLPDDELDLYLSATDVGVLPFRSAATSGSLATWLAAGRPLVAADLPLFREYAARAPGLLRLVRPEDPAALATALREALDEAESAPAGAPAAIALAACLSPARTGARYAALYDRHARGSRS